jgi:hypothetical protein
MEFGISPVEIADSGSALNNPSSWLPAILAKAVGSLATASDCYGVRPSILNPLNGTAQTAREARIDGGDWTNRGELRNFSYPLVLCF